jgi:hypothetical protein
MTTPNSTDAAADETGAYAIPVTRELCAEVDRLQAEVWRAKAIVDLAAENLQLEAERQPDLARFVLALGCASTLLDEVADRLEVPALEANGESEASRQARHHAA